MRAAGGVVRTRCVPPGGALHSRSELRCASPSGWYALPRKWHRSGACAPARVPVCARARVHAQTRLCVPAYLRTTCFVERDNSRSTAPLPRYAAGTQPVRSAYRPTPLAETEVTR
jgi:hypothetical protein